MTILKDSRSPKRAHRLAHRRSDNIHHPLRGLKAATGSKGGDLGGAGESCAAERRGHVEGHCFVCVVERFVQKVCCCLTWSACEVVCYARVRSCEGGDGMLDGLELGWWSAPRCVGGPKAERPKALQASTTDVNNVDGYPQQRCNKGSAQTHGRHNRKVALACSCLLVNTSPQEDLCSAE